MGGYFSKSDETTHDIDLEQEIQQLNDKIKELSDRILILEKGE